MNTKSTYTQKNIHKKYTYEIRPFLQNFEMLAQKINGKRAGVNSK